MFYVFFTFLSLGTSAYPWLTWTPVPECFAAQEGVPCEKVHYFRKYSHGQFVLLLLGWESLLNRLLWPIRLIKCDLFIQQIFREHLLSSRVSARAVELPKDGFRMLSAFLLPKCKSLYMGGRSSGSQNFSRGRSGTLRLDCPSIEPSPQAPTRGEQDVKSESTLLWRWVGMSPEQGEHFYNCTKALYGMVPLSRV